MSRISVRKATNVAFEFLGPLLQITGIMLFLFGAFVFGWDYLDVPHTPFTVTDAGVVLPASGIVLLIIGSIIVRSVEVDPEAKYRLDPLPSGPAELSRERFEYSPAPPRASSRPSCGYVNQDGGFFCAACNSALWPSGTPTKQPLTRSVVEGRTRRRIAIGKAKRIFILSIVAFAAVSPVLVLLTVGYLAVNEASLTVYSASFSSDSGQSTGNLIVNWYLVSRTAGNFPDPSDLSYWITINGSHRLTAPSPQALIRADCVMVPGLVGSELNESTVRFTVTGVVSESVWRQQITRSTSLTCSILGLYGFCR